MNGTVATRPAAARSNPAAVAASVESGFSQTTCLPASRAAIATGAWRWFGVQTWTTSTSASASSASRSGYARSARSSPRATSARAAVDDEMPTSRPPATRMAWAWTRPMKPAPTIAARCCSTGAGAAARPPRGAAELSTSSPTPMPATQPQLLSRCQAEVARRATEFRFLATQKAWCFTAGDGSDPPRRTRTRLPATATAVAGAGDLLGLLRDGRAAHAVRAGRDHRSRAVHRDPAHRRAARQRPARTRRCGGVDRRSTTQSVRVQPGREASSSPPTSARPTRGSR